MNDTVNKKTGRTSQYWICSECADELKWVGPNYAVTVISGLCGHCARKDEVFLTPTCDFKKPGGPTPVWD